MFILERVWQNNDLKTWCNLTHEQRNDLFIFLPIFHKLRQWLMRIIWGYLKIILNDKSISRSFSIHSLSFFFFLDEHRLSFFWASVKSSVTTKYYLSSLPTLIIRSNDYFCPDFVAFVMLRLKWTYSSFKMIGFKDLVTEPIKSDFTVCCALELTGASGEHSHPKYQLI